MKKLILVITALLLLPGIADALTLEHIKFGDMNQWVKRNIKESGIIGGDNKTVYAIGPNIVINGDEPYVNRGGSPWASSNVMAKVAGVTKTSNAVFPDTRGGSNHCAKLCTIMEHVKALGIINMDVLVSGSIFLGRVMEPIKSTKNPYSKMEMGVPYHKRPNYLVFDYKVNAPRANRTYSSGFGSKKTVAGQDHAEVYILLQKRWEDAKGNLHALRVGTGRERYGKSTTNWVNSHKIPVYYGNIVGKPFFKSYMGLIPKESSYYARNSKGKMVPVVEEGWADANVVPTHVLVMASSGCGTAYVGTPGMALWIDNIAFGFE